MFFAALASGPSLEAFSAIWNNTCMFVIVLVSNFRSLNLAVWSLRSKHCASDGVRKLDFRRGLDSVDFSFSFLLFFGCIGANWHDFRCLETSEKGLKFYEFS